MAGSVIAWTVAACATVIFSAMLTISGELAQAYAPMYTITVGGAWAYLSTRQERDRGRRR